MSKLPRKVSGQDVLKVLQKHGFTIRQGRGSHMGAWKRVGDRTIWLTIPLHVEIKPATDLIFAYETRILKILEPNITNSNS